MSVFIHRVIIILVYSDYATKKKISLQVKYRSGGIKLRQYNKDYAKMTFNNPCGFNLTLLVFRASWVT